MKKKVHLIEGKQLSHQLGVGGGQGQRSKSECEGEKWMLERGQKLSTGTRPRITQQTNTLWRNISSQI